MDADTDAVICSEAHMLTHIVVTLGGVGIFLLGMTLLTDGLRSLSGDTIRSILANYTRTPTRGAIAGALATAIAPRVGVRV